MSNICCPYLHAKLFTRVQLYKLEAASWTHTRSSMGGRLAGWPQPHLSSLLLWDFKESWLSDNSGSPPASWDRHRDHRETHTNTYQGVLAQTPLLLGPEAQAVQPDLHRKLYRSLLAVDFDLWKTNEKKLSPQIPSTFYLVIQHNSHKAASHISFSFHLDTKQLF